MRRNHSKKRQSGPFVVANHRIRASEVRVLDDQGEQLGIMPTKEAMMQAHEEGKDLVLITEQAKPPVAKIIDLAKFKYQQQQRDAENRKKAKTQELKEVRFTPFMADGDFNARAKKVAQFLKKGDKVRLSLQFKGRAITKKEFGYDVFERIIEATKDIASVEMAPKMMGKKLIAQLQPSK